MKFNKWTLGLAAVGAVSMASAVRADEAKPSALNTALSNTTISGYVSTSMNWQVNHNAGDGDSVGEAIPMQNGKANGFNLDVVKLTIAKPEDESPWASGYEVDLLFGPDATGIGNQSVNSTTGSQVGNEEFAIQQAFVTLRTPVGNGIDWKIGVFNTVVGYESFDAGSNPNYTRSWGWAAEPTEHTGILGTYAVNSEWSFSAGIANTLKPGINVRNTYRTGENTSQWDKTGMGSVTFTAPSTWGWASGSAFYAGMVYGFAGGTQGSGGTQGGNQQNYYLGATLNSPWKQVTFGAAFDYVQNVGGSVFGGSPFHEHVNEYIFGLYNTIKATDKLSFNSRAEYWELDANGETVAGLGGTDSGIEISEDVEYDLWANVVSRLEVRYDKIMTGDFSSFLGYYTPSGANVTMGENTSVGIYANIIYKF